jgi:hypothetical protein
MVAAAVAVDCSIASNPSAACAKEEFPLTSKTALLGCESIDPTVSCQSKRRRAKRGQLQHQLGYWSSFPLSCRCCCPKFCQYRTACCALQPNPNSSPPLLDRSAAVLNRSSLCKSIAHELLLMTRKGHTIQPLTLVTFLRSSDNSLPHQPHRSSFFKANRRDHNHKILQR